MKHEALYNQKPPRVVKWISYGPPKAVSQVRLLTRGPVFKFRENLGSCCPVPLPDAARDFLYSGLAMKVPVEVLVHSKAKTLELAYADGTRAIFPFEFLRVFSPSA